MQTRTLRNLSVSEIGMGCMGFSHGYGKIPEEQYSIDAIRKVYDYGYTFFDTAEGYGPNLEPQNSGHNEKILGKAVRGFRSKVVLATKMTVPTEMRLGKTVCITQSVATWRLRWSVCRQTMWISTICTA